MRNKKTDRIYIRIEPELKAELKNYLNETGRTISWLVNKMIKDELERYYKNRQ